MSITGDNPEKPLYTGLGHFRLSDNLKSCGKESRLRL